MTWNSESKNRAEEPVEMEAFDPALRQALGDFKASVHGWSDAVYARPRTARQVVVRKSWQLAAGWSLATLLIAGTVSGGFYERHERVVAAQLAAQRAAEQRQAELERAQKQAMEDEEMLATVDTAVSREVPAAMEPLAQLSEDSESR